ncbi:hypothetical protein BRETT_002529 [Brettanomyces bruxellensis]|uniref:TBP-associated factor 6 n=1 Tax=Dekkera bruxellensis TaxID=5007 RepID=A0A871RHC5_DEKBR|nr:uncharacterized protein BRETT_002529 [Brettanomyces bruxellensis]QOU22352.1 hypothetical protein BRETT_002529 [Brettanomyces bruxellensis]
MTSNHSSTKVPSSHTLWSPYDTVKDVADALGVTNQLNEEVAKNLAMDVEYRIHEILEQAMKFVRHGKRKVLTVEDINRAMKVLNLEPLYGYDVSRPLAFKEAMVGPGQNLYYVDDDEVDFEKLINQPLPKVPRFASVTAHWLAIEGVQPTIPQNPTPAEIRQLAPSQRGSMRNMLSLNNDEITLTTNPKTGVTTAEQRTESSKKKLDVKPLVKHVLSKELQLYFDKAIAALVNESDETLRAATLESIRSDPGLHQLVPYFIQFIAETITHNLQNIDLLTTISIHSCINAVRLNAFLAKNIGPTKGTPEELKQHFKVRELSASILEKIIVEYGSSYNTLKPRVTRTLLRAFLSSTTKTSVGTQFGAIRGMKSLGPEVIRIIFVGNLKNWSTLVLDHFHNEDPNRSLLLEQAIECLGILSSDGKLMAADHDSVISEDMKKKLEERVGSAIVEGIEKLDNASEVYYGIFFGEV